MFYEMQNKLSKTRDLPLEYMGQITHTQLSSFWKVLLDNLIFLSFFHSLPPSEERNMHSE